jgi:hypothetical protein
MLSPGGCLRAGFAASPRPWPPLGASIFAVLVSGSLSTAPRFLFRRPLTRHPIAAAGKPEAQAEGIRVASPETAPHSLGSRLGLQGTGPPNQKNRKPIAAHIRQSGETAVRDVRVTPNSIAPGAAARAYRSSSHSRTHARTRSQTYSPRPSQSARATNQQHRHAQHVATVDRGSRPEHDRRRSQHLHDPHQSRLRAGAAARRP